ncbi:MAG: nuclear transport factor 2 family protein [Acidobacteria bacterium]|nr:nuclear transport factor 2 family protein [Acidobacteriota bacterium]
MNLGVWTARAILAAFLGLLPVNAAVLRADVAMAVAPVEWHAEAADDEKAKAEIIALVDRFNKAINDGDVPGSVAVYDLDVESFPLFTIKYLTTEQRLAAAKRAAASGVKVTTKRNDDMKIHLVGDDTAWAHWTWHTVMITPAGVRSEADGRTTFILEKRKGEWRVVHSHISEPLKSGPPQPAPRPSDSK